MAAERRFVSNLQETAFCLDFEWHLSDKLPKLPEIKW